MDRADIAIFISLASAFITAGGLFWQIILYRLSGARLNVALHPCLVDEHEIIYRGAPKGWPQKTPPGFLPGDRWTFELAAVTITNIGRAPISIQSISLDIGRYRRHSFGRWTVASVPFAVSNGIKDNRCRLDPGDSVTAYLDVWRAVEIARVRRRKVVVRGSAQPVGRRAKRSSWVQRWSIDVNVQSIHPQIEHTPEREAYRELWRSLRTDDELYPQISRVWAKVRMELRKEGDVEDVMNAITSIVGNDRIDLAIDTAEKVCSAYVGSPPDAQPAGQS